MAQKRIGILTLGCKVNQYESEAIAEALRARDFQVCESDAYCDGYIVNTCTVTAEADRKSRQMIRRLARHNPSAKIVVTGCTVEYSSDQLSRINGVAAICGNANKLKCAELMAELLSSSRTCFDTPLILLPPLADAGFEQMTLSGFPRTRVYIKIEDGCENKCAYCAIPGARGPVRSKRPEDILREVEGFLAEGCREIVLTGIETASYGKDLSGVTLSSLIKEVDAIAGNCRIRLGSLDPSLFKEKFVSEISSLHSLAPHFHISLQSGSSHILALMKRKYNADGARAAIERLREAIPNVMLTTDIIVGFPGESEENYLETENFLRRARFLTAHIFPYSERAGTPAATMPLKVPIDERRERVSRLIATQNEIRTQILNEEIARKPRREVLFETFSGTLVQGHTDSFIEVSVESTCDLRGKQLPVILTHHNNEVCFGRLEKGEPNDQ